MITNALYYPTTSCDHTILSLESSGHAPQAGYIRPTVRQRASATLPEKNAKTNVQPKDSSKSKRTNAAGKSNRAIPSVVIANVVCDVDAIAVIPSPTTFPAPLILPSDDLAVDPSYPPQSLRSWQREKERNEVTPERNVVYVAAPPDVESDVEFVSTWSKATKQNDRSRLETSINTLGIRHVVDYLTAFYDGLPVKLLPSPNLYFSPWDSGQAKTSRTKASSTAPCFIGLSTSTECVRIRTRASLDGVFPRQMNLDDLLDAAISMLPDDAYALLLLVDHDLFEDEDDEFVCGRAYGGSRVAVVSTARYNPGLDFKQDVERHHAWPLSHCEIYMQERCATIILESKARLTKKVKSEETTSDRLNSSPPWSDVSPTRNDATLALCAAVLAHSSQPSLDESSSAEVLSGLWLGRICRTASHELGHCFGIDHCVYYACAMQGSASLTEDARQPPYLCPVDLSKLLRATGASMEQRYLALLSFCNQHGSIHVFAAFAAWIRVRLMELKASKGC